MSPRKALFPIEPIILNRWSSRAMTGQEITDEELMCLFEAARWAQSSGNNQPWRFIYAKRTSTAWNNLFHCLVPANQRWAGNAAVLILVVSKNTFDFNNRPSRTHSFDAGAAAQNLALQGTSMGLVVHGMEGFDYDKAREVVALPEGYTVEALFAVGRYGNLEKLPEDLQKREVQSDRKALIDLIFEGTFKE